MKRRNLPAFLILFLVSLSVCAQNSTSFKMKKVAIRKWYHKKEWLNGASLTPHASIDKAEFARQYHLNKTYWDKAFLFLRDHNLDSLPKGRYPIDGENVFATVTEDPTRDFEKTGWESHRQYIDLQCVISGEEKMGVWPVADAKVIKPYDEKKDVANYEAPGNFYVAPAKTFFIFFPINAHRPNITPGGNKVEKKIVIKIRVA
jgi:YhcH/YjgK/YiaL family protein